jgi:hypothetical protein
MWLLGGAKTKFKSVRGGYSEDRHCDECEETTSWRECDVRDRLSLFFIDLVDTTQRRLVCMECGSDAELPARKTQPIAKPVQNTPSPRRPSARETDKMLAELKKKMGR